MERRLQCPIANLLIPALALAAPLGLVLLDIDFIIGTDRCAGYVPSCTASGDPQKSYCDSCCVDWCQTPYDDWRLSITEEPSVSITNLAGPGEPPRVRYEFKYIQWEAHAWVCPTYTVQSECPAVAGWIQEVGPDCFERTFGMCFLGDLLDLGCGRLVGDGQYRLDCAAWTENGWHWFCPWSGPVGVGLPDGTVFGQLTNCEQGCNDIPFVDQPSTTIVQPGTSHITRLVRGFKAELHLAMDNGAGPGMCRVGQFAPFTWRVTFYWIGTCPEEGLYSPSEEDYSFSYSTVNMGVYGDTFEALQPCEAICRDGQENEPIDCDWSLGAAAPYDNSLPVTQGGCDWCVGSLFPD